MRNSFKFGNEAVRERVIHSESGAFQLDLFGGLVCESGLPFIENVFYLSKELQEKLELKFVISFIIIKESCVLNFFLFMLSIFFHSSFVFPFVYLLFFLNLRHITDFSLFQLCTFRVHSFYKLPECPNLYCFLELTVET